MEYDDRTGGYRQRKSGALIFPPNPEQVKAQKTRKKLEEELEDVGRLKNELTELLDELKKGKEES